MKNFISIINNLSDYLFFFSHDHTIYSPLLLLFFDPPLTVTPPHTPYFETCACIFHCNISFCQSYNNFCLFFFSLSPYRDWILGFSVRHCKKITEWETKCYHQPLHICASWLCQRNLQFWFLLDFKCWPHGK